MKVELIREHEDGSADYSFELTDEQRNTLLCLGIMTAIKAGLEEGKKYVPTNSEVDMGDSECRAKDCIYGTCVESDKSNCNRLCGSFKVPDQE